MPSLLFETLRRDGDVNQQPLEIGGEKIKTKHLPDDDNPLEMATVRQKGNKACNFIQWVWGIILTNEVLEEVVARN